MSNPIKLSIVSLLCKWVMGRSNDPESYPLPGGSGFIVCLEKRGSVPAARLPQAGEAGPWSETANATIGA